MNGYDRQDRGNQEEYAAYFAGMDKSMQQKVALTTAHFPPVGRVADMGSGSGRATFDLATLYPGLNLVGVDVNPQAVEHAAQSFSRPNLSYQVGDIANALFDEDCLDGILNSSVLHHVTSFNGFSLHRVMDLLDHQVQALRPGGVLIIRDFVVPRGPAWVHLHLRHDDGNATGELASLSTAALFEVFARDFRSSQNRTTPVPYTRLAGKAPGTTCFHVTLRAASEFVLRKDYRDHWDVELQEEYTYFTQHDFERHLQRRGLRVVTSAELYNPWIVENRFRGQIRVTDTVGNALGFPPTNYLVVGEKVPQGGGVLLRERGWRNVAHPRFLRIRRYRHTTRGHVMELAERPHPTLDLLPWFEHHGRTCILARHGFPRPVVQAWTGGTDLMGQSSAGYMTEPLAAVMENDLSPHEQVAAVLAQRAGMDSTAVHEVSPPWHYYTSPGGVAEQVQARLVRVAPWQHERRADNYSPFSTSGTVRYMDATQVLRASHVGGMTDARLEVNIYRLLLQQQAERGPWIGAQVELAPAANGPAALPAAQVLAVPQRQAYVALPQAGPLDFLQVREGLFEEVDATGAVLHTAPWEYVVADGLSHNTVSVLPVMRVGNQVRVGLERRDLPAVQLWEGTSAIMTVPAYRLATTVQTLDAAQAQAGARVEREFGLSLRRSWALGGRYHPSMGVTPEVVYPYLAEVQAVNHGARPLHWVVVEDALEQMGMLRDAHLLVSLFRAAHALGLGRPTARVNVERRG